MFSILVASILELEKAEGRLRAENKALEIRPALFSSILLTIALHLIDVRESVNYPTPAEYLSTSKFI